MEAREVKLIDTSGRNGLPAPEFMGDRPPDAPTGTSGLHGRSAGAPTAGTPGTDIRIRIAYASEEPGTVQVAGEGPHTGQMWKIARDEKMLLKAHGGAGGQGGRGEDGQEGGRGRDGRDATRYRNGEDGQHGAPGGNGGYGSDGADGAAGGNVFVTVHEEDTDLLLPFEYLVHGGTGGKSGQHGEPGNGGVGGRGGAPHAWTERHSDYVVAKTRPGGSNGQNGPPGMRASTLLSGGRSGPSGSVQIKVIGGDLSEATYPGVYNLQVVNFDIIDENEDGINEPGEHIHVHNIRVRNVGGMPSPEARSIHILIQGTQFLEPIASEPIFMPKSIQPGQEVEVPGILRAYIRNEWAEKPLGKVLTASESVQLVAYFNERLNRPLPNFCGPAQIFIRYPLELDPPTYLDCVAKGSTVRFRWKLHNNSSKAYGIDGILRRAAATRMSDPNRFFTLTYATADKPDEVIDDLSEIEPQSVITIDQDFSVNPNTMEYSEGNLSLELMLSDPKTGALRSVQKHAMHMQISGIYSLSEKPSFLLVVNSKTPNHAIHQIITLVRTRLHTSLDIFNLSLTGSYESPFTKTNVLKSYEGKSVIIFGNRFPYFSQGEKSPWDLLDPWETGLLMKAGTNVLFVAVQDLPSLNEWAKKMTFPAQDFTPGTHSIQDVNAKNVVSAVSKTDPQTLTSDMVSHRFTVAKSIFSSLPSSVDSAAKSAAKRLNKNIPLRRFVAVPDAQATDATGKKGGVIICEGVPKNVNLMASVDLFPMSPPGTHMITDYHLFFITSCLPFSVRVKMFWNTVGHANSSGVPCDVVYNKLDTFYNNIPGNPAFVDKKILDAVSLSLQFSMTAEIYRFISSRPRFPDPLSGPAQLDQLPQIRQFFAAAPGNAQINDIASAQPLISTLGAIHALSNPLSAWQSFKSIFGFLGNRKARLTPQLNSQIFASMASTCTPAVAGTAKSHLLQRSKQVKAGIRAKGGKKRYQDFGLTEVAAFAGTTGATVVELVDVFSGSVALDQKMLDAMCGTWQSECRNREAWEGGAKMMLKQMVNPVDD
ncbi:hypothetical protein BCR34DRAFT_582903 [Clohesyomyces aquaticus]|uniref:DUF7932 domain-containing protein n=1 Tax=Clohesyomyces aquaticus TaxID=1231657 RepID=A0A1Y2A800_9PLEO|nr:hypothetical protein BCR34DRAFT_582903 [Clohesyomyces aquaticus]